MQWMRCILFLHIIFTSIIPCMPFAVFVRVCAIYLSGWFLFWKLSEHFVTFPKPWDMGFLILWSTEVWSGCINALFLNVIHFFFLTEFLCDIEIKCFLLIVAAFMCWQKFCLCILEAVWKSSIFLSPEVHCLKSVLTHIIFVLLWHTVLYCYSFILLFFSHHRFTVSRACANTYHFGTPKAHVYTVLYCYIFILLFFSHHRFTISRACANTYYFGTPKAHVYTVLYCYIFILLFFSHHRFTISRACANT